MYSIRKYIYDANIANDEMDDNTMEEVKYCSYIFWYFYVSLSRVIDNFYWIYTGLTNG